jgi:hypothetical protein
VKEIEHKRIRHGIQHALKEVNVASKRAIVLNVTMKKQKWRRCSVGVDRLNNELHNFEHNFSDKEKQHVLKRFLDREDVKSLIPNFSRNLETQNKNLPFFTMI